MRYESFYPFSGNQSPSPSQQGFGTNPFPGSPQNPGQSAQFHMPQNPFPGPGQGPDPSMQGSPMQGPPTGQGPSKIDGYMQTANSFLNTAQQFAPVVQQFAPMMKNIPAMWRLYKGFQAMPAAGAPSIGGGLAASAAQATAQSVVPSISSGPSTPRIFQPGR